MRVPWLAQVRLLHMAVLGLVAATCLIYLAYVTSPDITTTSSLRPPSDLQSFNNKSQQSNTSAIIKNVVSPLSSSAPPPPILIGLGGGSSSSSSTSSLALSPSSVVMAAAPLLPLSSGARSSIIQGDTHGKNKNDGGQVVHDLTLGVPAEEIYQSGHSDVSSHLCPELGGKTKLLIIITSAPSHESARRAIRETWGSFASHSDVSIAFMLGSLTNETIIENIRKEQSVYGDIITGMFIDTYDNLTLKTISLLEWVDNYCPKTDFVLKTDDDMFINVSRLLAFIAKHNHEQRAIYGRLAKKWKPIRNKKSKYYISPQQYKPAVFPDFTTGPAYLFPARLAKELYVAALRHTYFKLEDVFVTGIVANDLKIKRVHAPEFLNKRTSLTSCSVQKGISIHMVKGIEQYDLWKKLHEQVTRCNK